MFELSEKERKELELIRNLWGREYNFRVEIVLACAEPGVSTREVARKLGTSYPMSVSGGRSTREKV